MNAHMVFLLTFIYIKVLCSYPFDADMGLVQLFCDGEHNTQLVSDLGKVELFVDTNDLMHENKIDVVDALLRSQYDISSDFPMHEANFFDDNETELGLDNLFDDCENDTTVLGSDLGRLCNG